MLFITHFAELVGELTFVSMAGQFYILPFLIYLNVADTANTNRWMIWGITTLLLGYPNGKLYSSRSGCEGHLTDPVNSSPNPGRLELTQLEQRTLSYRFRSLL